MNLVLLELSTHAFYELLAACSIDQNEQHNMKKHGCTIEISQSNLACRLSPHAYIPHEGTPS